jgi:hypothetical protein
MDIRNFTQFAHLLNSKQATNLHPSFNKLVMCMMLYNSMCACGGNSNADKSNKHSECNRIYRESLGTVNEIKAHLFKGCNDNTISFYIDDNHHVKTLNR